MSRTLSILFLVLITQNTNAQVSGLVKDSITKKLISYINIWVENENIGTTSTINGEFILPEIGRNKTLVFSAIGYETKKVAVSKLKEIIYLNPTDYQLSEVVIHPKRKPKTLKIGSFKKSSISFYWVSSSQPWIIARYFSYKTEYTNTPYLKSLRINTECHAKDAKNAKFNIRLYSVGKNGEPDNYLNSKNIFGIAGKGSNYTNIDLSKLNIQFPSNGFFVAVEWLIINENKYEFDATQRGSNKKIHIVRYGPSIGTIPCETDEISWSFINGIWKKTFKNNQQGPKSYQNKYSVIAVELTLSD